MALITLAEAKTYLRVDTNDDDALIGGLLLSAGRLCTDVARLTDAEWAQADAEPTETDSAEIVSLRASLRVAIYFTLGYLYEHREEADHHDLLLTLRSLLRCQGGTPMAVILCIPALCETAWSSCVGRQ